MNNIKAAFQKICPLRQADEICVACKKNCKDVRDDVCESLYRAYNAGAEDAIAMGDVLRSDDMLANVLWKAFEDIPMNPETEEIEAEFLGFPAGTHREEIWHWFDKKHSKGVAYLLYGDSADTREEETDA